jgi:putative transposase
VVRAIASDHRNPFDDNFSDPDRGRGGILAMPSTHTSLHIHVVFSTKNRHPLIASEWQSDLHAFLGGVLKRLDAFPQEIGGVADHVHLLMGIKPVHAIADLVREAKRVSSEWIKEAHGVRTFGWQEGYGAFSVSKSAVSSVRTYIQEQEKHHQRRTFQEEYLEFLKKHGIDFDERYLW